MVYEFHHCCCGRASPDSNCQSQNNSYEAYISVTVTFSYTYGSVSKSAVCWHLLSKQHNGKTQWYKQVNWTIQVLFSHREELYTNRELMVKSSREMVAYSSWVISKSCALWVKIAHYGIWHAKHVLPSWICRNLNEWERCGKLYSGPKVVKYVFGFFCAGTTLYI